MPEDDAYLAALPPLRDVIRLHDLRAEKSLGQNFILDGNVTDRIARAGPDPTGMALYEIGPGPGGLTRSLLKTKAASVTAIEFDDRAITALAGLQTAAGQRLKIVKGDALHVDLQAMHPAPRAIVANLPYNISTVLLIKWLREIHADPESYDFLTLMFQKEVAERLFAKPHTKAYGRLSVLTQWLCDCRRAFDLPPEVFSPPPKVTSSVVVLKPYRTRALNPSFASVETILASGFQQRRKMVRTSLAQYSTAMERENIDLTLRAENIDIETWLRLAGGSV